METKQSDETCYFWKPPLEVRDTIYALLYDGPRVLRLRKRPPVQRPSISPYPRPHPDRAGVVQIQAPAPFPESIISELVVSKQYFNEATRLFFRLKTLDTSWDDIWICRTYPNAVDRETFSYITALDLSGSSAAMSCDVDCLTDFPKLRTLCLTISECYLNDPDERSALGQRLDDAEMLTKPIPKAFCLVRGIERLTIKRHVQYDVQHPEDLATLQANLDLLETFIRQQVTRPRPAESASQFPMGIAAALKLKSPSQQPTAPIGLQTEAARPGRRVMRDSEVPRDSNAIVKMFLDRPQDIVAWINGAKDRLDAQS